MTIKAKNKFFSSFFESKLQNCTEYYAIMQAGKFQRNVLMLEIGLLISPCHRQHH